MLCFLVPYTSKTRSDKGYLLVSKLSLLWSTAPIFHSDVCLMVCNARLNSLCMVLTHRKAMCGWPPARGCHPAPIAVSTRGCQRHLYYRSPIAVLLYPAPEE